MIELIRIEHPDSGVGIFRHNYSEWECLQKFYDRHQNLPSPSSEKESDEMRNVFLQAVMKKTFHGEENTWLCAYKSFEELLEWVLVEEFKLIIKAGFRFYLIKTENCVTGKYQTIFKKESIVEKIDITNLFETKD